MRAIAYSLGQECAHHDTHTSDCSYETNGICSYTCAICPVQDLQTALINGLQARSSESYVYIQGETAGEDPVHYGTLREAVLAALELDEAVIVVVGTVSFVAEYN